jgi:hypothetical protein
MLMRTAILLAALAIAQPAFAQEAPVVQHFTVKVPSIDGADESDASPMVCRAPQGKSDTRLPGPRVCKTQKQWDALHAQGLDIGADGKSVVASEKYRSLNPGSCGATSGCN